MQQQSLQQFEGGRSLPRRFTTFIAASAMAFLLVACASETQDFLDASLTGGNSMPEALAREYQAAASANARHSNWDAAGWLAGQGNKARRGEVPAPLNPAELPVLEDDVASLDAARRIVSAAMISSDASARPAVCAQAQRRYDEWVLVASANRYAVGGSYLGGPGGPVHEERVVKKRAAFATSLEACSPRYFAMLGDASPVVAVAPAPRPAAGAEKITERVIYFAFNSAKLDDLARDVLSDIAAMRSEYRNFSVRIEGHTDTSGPRGYNQQLGLKRADMVARALRSMQVRNAGTSSRGETSPAVQTGDGVREPLNRRAEISIYGAER